MSISLPSQSNYNSAANQSLNHRGNSESMSKETKDSPSDDLLNSNEKSQRLEQLVRKKRQIKINITNREYVQNPHVAPGRVITPNVNPVPMPQPVSPSSPPRLPVPPGPVRPVAPPSNRPTPGYHISIGGVPIISFNQSPKRNPPPRQVDPNERRATPWGKDKVYLSEGYMRFAVSLNKLLRAHVHRPGYLEIPKFSMNDRIFPRAFPRFLNNAQDVLNWAAAGNWPQWRVEAEMASMWEKYTWDRGDYKKGSKEARTRAVEDLKRRLEQNHNEQVARDLAPRIAAWTENLKQQHTNQVLEWEQRWAREKENVKIVDGVRLREVATSSGLTASPLWPQWERDWQQEEQTWQNFVKTEWDKLQHQFRFRDWTTLGYSATADQVNAENQWRQASKAALEQTLTQIRTQKAQLLQDRLNQLEAAERLRIQKEAGQIVEFFAEAATNGAAEYLETLGKEEVLKQEIANWEAALSYKNTQPELGKPMSDSVNIITGAHNIRNVDHRGSFPLEIGRTYSSQQLEDSAFGYGWKMSGIPSLIPSADGSLFYGREADGLIIVYSQDPRNANRWVPTPEKNPHLNKVNRGILKSVITKHVADADVQYILEGFEGDKRTFKIDNSTALGYPTLEKWEDNKGNYYTFERGMNILENDYKKLAKIVSNSGDQLHFTYDQKGRIIKSIAGENQLQYRYSQDGDLIQVSRLKNNEEESVQNTYDYQQTQQIIDNEKKTFSTHRIIREKTTEGRILENSYDVQGRVTRQKVTAASVPVRNISFTYKNSQASNKTGSTTIKDVQNKKTRYEYVNGLVTKITDLMGQSIHQEWYPVGDASPGAYPRSLKQYTDKRGLITQFKYDAKGNVTEKTIIGDITGEGTTSTLTTKLSYNDDNLPIRVSDSLGNEIAAFYEDSRYPGLATRIERKIHGQTIFNIRNTYSAVKMNEKSVSGLLLKQQTAADTPDEAIVEYTYNEKGLLLSQRRITGNSDPDVITEFEYNTRGELLKQIDESGISVYIPDSAKKQMRVERRGKAGNLLASQITHYNPYGQANRIDQLGRNTGRHLLFDYDGAGLLKSWKISGNHPNRDIAHAQIAENGAYWVTSYDRDPLGNITAIRRPRGDQTRMSYDAIGQMVSRTSQKPGENLRPSTERFAYGPGGEIISYIDSSGRETKYSYTTDGKLRRQENSDGTTQEWRYQPDGRLIKEIESDGSYWETTYNDLERTITRTRKDSADTILSKERFVFDRRGNVISYTDKENRTFLKDYDQLNRLKTEFEPAETPHAAQRWTHISYGRNDLMVSNHLGEKQIFTKDALGRITSLVNEDRNNQKTAKITYDYSGKTIGIIETKGSVTTITHLDPANWMTSIGELGEGIFHGAVQGDYYNPSNTAQVIGKFIGQVATSFVPGIGQAADIRDLTAAFNAGRTEGWNVGTSIGVMAAGLAFLPLLGDVAKAGVKPLLGKSVSAISDVAKGTGPYRYVAGHHVHAKKAFEGAVNYNFQEAFSISADILKQQGVRHATITAAQQRLFREFAASGAPNTLAHHSRIAYQAMVQAGMEPSVAKEFVMQSQLRLIQRGVLEPTKIPWGGK